MYLHAKTETQLVVDTSRGGKLHINVITIFLGIVTIVFFLYVYALHLGLMSMSRFGLILISCGSTKR